MNSASCPPSLSQKRSPRLILRIFNERYSIGRLLVASVTSGAPRRSAAPLSSGFQQHATDMRRIALLLADSAPCGWMNHLQVWDVTALQHPRDNCAHADDNKALVVHASDSFKRLPLVSVVVLT